MSNLKKILVIHGPNLDILGRREPEIYGDDTLEEINSMIRKRAAELSLEVEFFQSNHEGEIIDRIASSDAYSIIINPAGLTHTSVSLLDALRAFGGSVIEVHLSNILGREDFRQRSVTAAAARGLISGFGAKSYLLALDAAAAE